MFFIQINEIKSKISCVSAQKENIQREIDNITVTKNELINDLLTNNTEHLQIRLSEINLLTIFLKGEFEDIYKEFLEKFQILILKYYLRYWVHGTLFKGEVKSNKYGIPF